MISRQGVVLVFLFLVSLLAPSGQVNAQSFEAIQLTNDFSFERAIGDFDNDGRLDLCYRRWDNGRAEIWINPTGTNFIFSGVSFPSRGGPPICLDFNNDGRLDIYMWDTNVWLNQTNTFVPRSLPGKVLGFLDYNLDGQVDLFRQSTNDGRDILLQQSGEFVPAWISTDIFSHFADFNGDSSPDLLDSGRKFLISDDRGDPQPFFSNLRVIGITTDWNDDGRADVLANDWSKGGFVLATNAFPVFNHSSIVSNWITPELTADFNNDGFSDLVSNEGKIHFNTGQGFTSSEALPVGSSAVRGDLNGDGRVDLLSYSRLLLNRGPLPVATGHPPTNLATVVIGQRAHLLWDPVFEHRHGTYNVRVGTNVGGVNILSPLANPLTGQRQVPASGNAGTRRFSIINLVPGQYSWSVQSIDAALNGSPFAQDLPFTVGEGPSVVADGSDSLTIHASYFSPFPSSFWIEYGTNETYGFQTASVASPGTTSIVLTNVPSGAYISYRCVVSNAHGVLRGVEGFALNPGLPSISSTSAPVVGFGTVSIESLASGMGHPAVAYVLFGKSTNTLVASSELLVDARAYRTNLLFTLNVEPGSEYFYRVVTSNAAGMFVTADSSFTTPFFTSVAGQLPGLRSGASVWLDVDLDGTLEIALTGSSQSNTVGIWRRTAFNENYTLVDRGILNFNDGSFAVADIDRDGDPDVYAGGMNGGALYQNSTNRMTPFRSIVQATFGEWGDMNNDGTPELFLSSPYGSLLFSSTGASLMTLSPSSRSGRWGDYDRDGRLDILTTGPLAIWRNTAFGFTNLALTGDNVLNAVWVDWNSDGWLDVLAIRSTWSGSIVRPAMVFLNRGGTFESPLLLGDNWTGNPLIADFNNDGTPDVLARSYAINSYQIGLNVATGLVTQAWSFPRTTHDSVSMGDAFNDGRLAILLSGNTNRTSGYTPPASFLFRNASALSNSPPFPPMNQRSVARTRLGSLVTWDLGSDAQTTSSALTYNLYAAAPTVGGPRLYSPLANITNGILYTPAHGNLGTRRFATIPQGLKWSVQSVDGGFRGSPFTESITNIPGNATQVPLGFTNFFSSDIVYELEPASSNYWVSVEYVRSNGTSRVTSPFSPSVTEATIITNLLTDLEAASRYAWRLVLTNETESIYSEFHYFATPPSPSVGLSFSGSTVNTGTVLADVQTGGVSAWVWLEFSESPDRFERSTTPVYLVVSNRHQLSLTLTNLTPGGTVYFRAGFSNFVGLSFYTATTSLVAKVFGASSMELRGGNAQPIAAGDFDGDDDLDLAFEGAYSYIVVLEQRTTNLLHSTFYGGQLRSLSWINLQPDQTLDLAYVRASYNSETSIHTNLANGRLQPYGYLPVDLNNDGRWDQVRFTERSNIWIASGPGFIHMPSSVDGDILSAQSADLDRDGFMDLVIQTRTNSLRVLLNNGVVFTTALETTQTVRGVPFDHDGDGDLDLIASSYYERTPVSLIYSNSNAKFSDSGIRFFPTVSNPAVGDYNNDGWMDIFLNATFPNRVLERRTFGYYVPLDLGIPPLGGSLVLADYDRDGTLDVVAPSLGFVWTNGLPRKNLPPSAPTNSAAIWFNGHALLLWDAAADDTTPSSALSYEVAIGAQPGFYDLRIPLSNVETGFRRVPQIGNSGLFAVHKTDSSNSLYWRVQSVDVGFAGSQFSPERSWSIPSLGAPIVNIESVTLPISVKTFGESIEFKVEFGSGNFSNETEHFVQQPNMEAEYDVAVSNLVAGQTIQFRVSAVLNGTRAYGPAFRAFVPTAPQILTNRILSLTSSNVTFQLEINPKGLASTVWLEFSDGISNWVSSSTITPPAASPIALTQNYPVVIGRDYSAVLVLSNLLGTVRTAPLSFVPPEFRSPYFTGSNDSEPQVLELADFDRDGRLDLFNSSPDGVRIWFGTGAGPYSPANPFNPYPLSSVSPGNVFAVHDFGTDGFIDFAGGSSGLMAYVSGPFTGLHYLVWSTNFSGASIKSVAWADLDNDGRPDLISGDSSGYRLFRNQRGSGVLASLPSDVFSHGSIVSPGDIDHDGRVDLLQVTAARITLLTNSGSGFSEHWAVNSPGQDFGKPVHLVDLNNDGLLDLFIGHPTVSPIWINTGSSFTNSAFPGRLFNAQIDWGDYDNDGDLDGIGSMNQKLALFKNKGAGVFSKAEVFGLMETYSTSPRWVDYDRDGTLDLVAFQNQGARKGIAALRNELNVEKNTRSLSPTNLLVRIAGPKTVQLSWQPGADAQTPTNALTYNIRVGTTPGGIDIVSPMSDVTNGTRRVYTIGNAQHRLFSLLRLPPGTYYWSVQTIDSGFVGSTFAPEQSFVVEPYGSSISRGLVSSNQFRLSIDSVPNRTNRVFASTNLLNWIPLGIAPEIWAGRFEFLDTNAIAFPRRFYKSE